MSQPSASARLARLERQLGVPVLVRGARGSTLTPTGEAVFAWALATVNAARSLTDGVESLRENAGARLRIAASLTIAEYLMPRWLLALRRSHPDVEVVAAVANSRAVCDHVRSGAADVGFIEAPELPAGFSISGVGTDQLSLVASPGFVAELGLVEPTAARLLDLPILLRESGSGTRDTFMAALRVVLGHEPVLSHAVALGSTATILATARAGGGVGVVSRRAVRLDLDAGSLVEIQVQSFRAVRPLSAVWLGDRPTALARELIAHARESSRPHR